MSQVPGVQVGADGTIEVDLAVYEDGQPHWLSEPTPHVPVTRGRPVAKFNPNHVPAGSPEGGQFTSGPGGGGGAAEKPSAYREPAAAYGEDLAQVVHAMPGVEIVGFSASQPQHTRDKVLRDVPTTQEAFEHLLDRGDGVDARLQAEAILPQQFRPDRLVTLPPGRPVVIVAPPKGPRASEKVTVKYAGDWSRLSDMVRGTVAVDRAADMVPAAKAVRDEMVAKGWILAAVPEDRTAAPDESGYRDLTFKLRAPTGLVTEVKILTKPMLRAKEGEGHKLYERMRVLSETAARSGGWTDQAKVEFADLTRRSRALYDAAWKESGG